MSFNKNMGKMAKVFIMIFGCSTMQSGVTENSVFKDRVLYYNTKTNSTEASFSSSQHHASIRLKQNYQDFGDGHICSGVVVGPSVVLTTAQCVYNYNTSKPYHPSELTVILASLNRYQKQEQTLVFSVTHSYQPETFNATSLRANVAVLMLERDIPEMNEFVQPIALTRTDWYDKTNNTSNKFKVTSWLKTHEGLYLNHLMMFNVSKVSDEACSNYYGKTVFNTGMLCIISLKPLHKDFGSPLFSENKLVGLKSFAAGPLAPAIYTDVSYYENWIRSVIGNGSNQNSSVWGTLGFLFLTFLAFKRTKFMKSQSGY